jgi:hypothetical protein
MAQGSSLRQYISAGNDVPSLVLRLLQKKETLQVFAAFCLIVRTSPIHFALLGRKQKYIKSKTTAKLVRKTNLDRRGLRPIPIICHLLDPPSFSLPTTFKAEYRSGSSCLMTKNWKKFTAEKKVFFSSKIAIYLSPLP